MFSATNNALPAILSLFILFLAGSPAPVISSTSDELRSLLEFKKGIHTDPLGKITTTWNRTAISTTASDIQPCPSFFFGVVCDGNSEYVTGIVLDRLNLTGELKFSTLIGLKMLKKLSLVGNSFTGRLVPQLGSMSSLEHLDLSENQFIGRIPDRIHDLWGLQYLNLSNNGFDGGYPSGIRNLQQLRILDMHSNLLWGDIGVFFSELRNVEFVDLSSNNFSGELPEHPANVSSLGSTVRHMNLSGNMLSGKFFKDETLVLFKGLEALDLGGNRIVGELPTFRGLSNLKVLCLGDNMLFGEIPIELLVATSFPLQELDLSRNGFSGSITAINSTTLEILDLSSNRLTGNFPQFSSQSGLTTLKISSNSIEGDLPSEWLQFSRLAKVDLSANSFTGPVPPTLFSLNLIHLNLSRNRFIGEIPFTESKVDDLLAQPVFAPLELLDLSDNSLTGGLSTEIGFMRRLKVLNLAKNDLSGHIPGSLASIGGLESLDLSNNHLEGQLPNNLPSSLKALNLSYNDLSGTLPEFFRKFPQTSFFPGNEKLVIQGLQGSQDGGSRNSPQGAGSHGSHSGVKIAIILASVGATLMIAFVSLAYYRAHLHGFYGRNKLNGTIPGSDVKSRPSLFKFHASSDPSQTSLSFSNDLLLTSNSRSLSGQQVVHLPETSDQTTGTSYINPTFLGKPVVTSARRSPPGSPLSEQPVTMDVFSPDRFAGELCFLDSSLSFTPEQLSRAPAEVLGRSSHGTLYKATLDGGQMLAVKWLRVGLVKNKKEFAKEVKKISSTRHANIIPVRAYYWGPREQERLVLSDYIHGESLAVHLYESTPRRFSALSFTQRLTIAVDIARCLTFLHERGMVHGNLKPANILLASPNLSVYLSDFGLHRLMTPAGISEHILNLGALGYSAPELSNTSKPTGPTFKSDVYALGVIIMELLTRRSAGDIISGQSGAVDLTDWVRLCDREGRRMDCIDRVMAGGEDEKTSKVMNDMMGISLRCILAVNERPNIRQVLEDLSSLSG